MEIDPTRDYKVKGEVLIEYRELKRLAAVEEVEWCDAHDSKWFDFTPIEQGCGWGNSFKPCMKAAVSVRIYKDQSSR